MKIEGLHHNAYRCRDSEETRAFYEDFLGLPLAEALPIGKTATGRRAQVLHTFYRMGDGSFLAFFEAPDEPFEFREQRDFDLHIALEVSADGLKTALRRARGEGVEVRGPTDHGAIESIYLRDPNGYVIELCARRPGSGGPEATGGQARAELDAWQAAKAA